MKLSQKIQLVAEWLKSEENDLLVSAESNEDLLKVVANVLVEASEALEHGAVEVSVLEPSVDPEALDEIAALATAYDESGDEMLMKEASVLDSLLSMFAQPDLVAQAKAAEDDRIDELKKKYKGVKEQADKANHIAEAVKDIEKAPMYKEFRPLEAPLSARVCPEHRCQLLRVGENSFQCVLDKRIFNYEEGYTLLNGDKVPGTTISNQTQNLNQHFGDLIFDDRAARTGQNQ